MLPTAGRAASELETCLAFIRTLDARCAERCERFRFGTAYYCDSLPRVRGLTFLSLDRGPTPPVRELLAETDRLLAGFPHRKLVTDDDAVGSHLAQELEAHGWNPRPLLVMPHRGESRPVDTSRVREVTLEALRPLWESGTREAGFDDDLVRQTVGQRRIIGAAGAARYFAGGPADQVASYCELYSDGEVGQIEGVLTLPEYRNRGLAGAVVTRALAESRRAGNRLTFLLAEENDGPHALYRKLGFEVAGRIWDFQLAK